MSCMPTGETAAERARLVGVSPPPPGACIATIQHINGAPGSKSQTTCGQHRGAHPAYGGLSTDGGAHRGVRGGGECIYWKASDTNPRGGYVSRSSRGHHRYKTARKVRQVGLVEAIAAPKKKAIFHRFVHNRQPAPSPSLPLSAASTETRLKDPVRGPNLIPPRPAAR